MWSQSIPWRNPKRNAVIRNPRPNTSDDAVSTPLPLVAVRTSSNHICAVQGNCNLLQDGGSEDRRLAPGAEDRLQRLGDLPLGAPRPRASDQRRHQVVLRSLLRADE